MDWIRLRTWVSPIDGRLVDGGWTGREPRAAVGATAGRLTLDIGSAREVPTDVETPPTLGTAAGMLVTCATAGKLIDPATCHRVNMSSPTLRFRVQLTLGECHGNGIDQWDETRDGKEKD